MPWKGVTVREQRQRFLEDYCLSYYSITELAERFLEGIGFDVCPNPLRRALHSFHWWHRKLESRGELKMSLLLANDTRLAISALH